MAPNLWVLCLVRGVCPALAASKEAAQRAAVSDPDRQTFPRWITRNGRIQQLLISTNMPISQLVWRVCDEQKSSCTLLLLRSLTSAYAIAIVRGRVIKFGGFRFLRGSTHFPPFR